MLPELTRDRKEVRTANTVFISGEVTFKPIAFRFYTSSVVINGFELRLYSIRLQTLPIHATLIPVPDHPQHYSSR
jgi:hypothetical protein